MTHNEIGFICFDCDTVRVSMKGFDTVEYSGMSIRESAEKFRADNGIVYPQMFRILLPVTKHIITEIY